MAAWTEMSLAADRAAPNETGGILLGFWSKAFSEASVTEVVGAGPGAIHERYRFVPDHAYQEREVAVRYAASPSELSYLGDWHTHPGAPAYLSATDRLACRSIAEYKPARAPRPIMLILGCGPSWEPGAWQGRRGGRLWRSRFSTHQVTILFV